MIHVLENKSRQEPKAGKLTGPGVNLILSCQMEIVSHCLLNSYLSSHRLVQLSELIS